VQNNGVIALTRCASRYAGIACGVWLLIFGILSKVGGESACHETHPSLIVWHLEQGNALLHMAIMTSRAGFRRTPIDLGMIVISCDRHAAPGWVTTIPDCVLGGMTTFLFANVCVSGIKVGPTPSL
jgi:hypothetical protein